MEHTIDTGIGFQICLGNYIKEVVNEMKNGMEKIGKTWNDIDPTPVSESYEKESFFSLQNNELDALMDILREEMEDYPINNRLSTNASAGAYRTSSERF